MQISGDTIKRYRGSFRYLREDQSGNLVPYAITIQAVRSDWEAECARMLPRPVPAPLPGEYEKDSASGQLVPKMQDEAHPDHQAALQEWANLVAAKRIVDGTDDENVVFETDPALLEKSPREYYAAILAELDTAFGPGEIRSWSTSILMIGEMAGADIARAEEGFFRFARSISRIQAGDADELESVEVHPGTHDHADLPGVGEVAERV